MYEPLLAAYLITQSCVLALSGSYIFFLVFHPEFRILRIVSLKILNLAVHNNVCYLFSVYLKTIDHLT